jgi:hypothetical protein
MNKLYNPLTGHKIQIGGTTHNKLVRQGILGTRTQQGGGNKDDLVKEINEGTNSLAEDIASLESGLEAKIHRIDFSERRKRDPTVLHLMGKDGPFIIELNRIYSIDELGDFTAKKGMEMIYANSIYDPYFHATWERTAPYNLYTRKYSDEE